DASAGSRLSGLARIQENKKGCRPFTTSQSDQIRDKILVVDRGGCLFILKAFYAQAAGAHGIVKEAPQMGEGIAEDAIDIHSVMIGHSEGLVLLDWIREAETKDAAEEASNASGTGTRSMLVAGFVQRKLTKEQLANARLSYNSLPIVNIHSISLPMATFG
ncbi:hypothetical protein BGX29_011452, partial [Mortierella sp. GBA35]